MPTFKNNTKQMIIFEANGKNYLVLPNKDLKTYEWIPYQEHGLDLIDENYPPVPSSIVVSGKFKFTNGLERRFNVPHCESYTVKISVKSGKLKLFTGNSTLGVEIGGEYSTSFAWGYVPYFRVKGLEADTEALIHAEIEGLKP